MSCGGEIDGRGEGVVLLIGNVKESGVSRPDSPACSATIARGMKDWSLNLSTEANFAS